MNNSFCSCGRHRADCAYPSTFTHEDIMPTDTIQPGQGRDEKDLTGHIVSWLIVIAIVAVMALCGTVSWIIRG